MYEFLEGEVARRSAARLVLDVGVIDGEGYLALDGGCVWGGELAAIRLDAAGAIRLDCSGALRPD